MKLLISLVLNTVALLLTTKLLQNYGFRIDDTTAAFLAAIVLGVLNTFIRPFLLLVTFPINLLSLGLFTFVINALVLYIVAYFVPGVHIDSFVAAILAATVLSVLSTILSWFVHNVAQVK
jgi:putative membrane protein